MPTCRERGTRILRTFRDRIIVLARAGRGVESLAREVELWAAIIAGWIKQAGIGGGARDDGPTSLERERLTRLRKVRTRAEARMAIH